MKFFYLICFSLLLNLQFSFSFGHIDQLTLSLDSDLDGIVDNRHGRGMFGLTGLLSSGKKEAARCLNSNQDEGVCLDRSKCSNYGGTAGDSCKGGVCCIIRSMCSTNNTGQDVTVKRNMTHLVETPNYTPPAQCRYNIPKQKGVCQLRLDFKRFDLAPPDYNGNCNADILVVTGSDNIKTLKICGEATKQHLYLHYGSSDVISVNINLLNTNASVYSKATYDILVTMIRCNSIERAPEGCTQYFSQTSDEVRSFNYNKRAQLNEQMYMVCVRSFTGSTRVKWEKCTTTDSFFISGTGGTQSIIGSDCLTDYVEVLGTVGGKYCGSDFPLAVQTEAKPYMMWVNFNDQEIPLPNTPWNAEIGCYESWQCYDAADMVVTDSAKLPCNKVDTQYCKPPTWFDMQTDVGNIGFCLRYTVS